MFHACMSEEIARSYSTAQPELQKTDISLKVQMELLYHTVVHAESHAHLEKGWEWLECSCYRTFPTLTFTVCP